MAGAGLRGLASHIAGTAADDKGKMPRYEAGNVSWSPNRINTCPTAQVN